MVSHSQPTVLEILTLLDTFTYATDARTTLIDELIYESRRFYPSFESRLVQYKLNSHSQSTLDDQPSCTILDDNSND